MDINDDLKDAIEMMGWGDFEIHPANTVLIGSNDGLVECEQPTFIQIKTGFRNRHLARLKGAKLSVFLCIALHMDGKGFAFPSQETIAKETGYSRVEVSRCVSELEELKMLSIQRDTHQVNIYQVLQMARFGRARNEKLHAPQTKVTCSPDKSYTEEEPIKKNQEEQLRASARAELRELDQLFTELTGLPIPDPQTPKEKRADASAWYQPMRRMQTLANGQMAETLRSAIHQMRKDGLIISAPRSVENVFKSIYALKVAPAFVPVKVYE